VYGGFRYAYTSFKYDVSSLELLTLYGATKQTSMPKT